jgi:D-glycero-D-manno-heptose 1,7-bisphosphate phosphatase
VVFLDRDGVINRNIEGGYVTRWEEFEFLPGVLEGIRYLNELDIPVIVITNQSAVHRGLITEEGLEEIHRLMKAELAKRGAHIDDIFCCPHHPDEHCACRKPQPGLLLEAAAKYSIDFAASWLIGDSESDLEAGRVVGCQTCLFHPGDNLLQVLKGLKLDEGE